MKKYIAYYRVSTQKQGQSGLGLEAQRHAVRGFLRDAEIIEEYIEVESGKKNKRPELNAAIEKTKAAGATLIIAKLDRLSRNASFIFALRDSGVEFVCADMPDANTLTIGIFAVMAQHEREVISQRTKAALAAKKAQGYKLGSPKNNLTHEMRKASMQTRKENARGFAQQAAQYAQLLYKNGYTLQKIAGEFNARGFKTRRGKEFFPQSVKRLIVYS